MIRNKTRFQYLWFPAALILLMMLWSCAGLKPVPEDRKWACDAWADEAVQDGDWEQALLRHQEFLAANPDNCLAVYHLGYIWGRLGDREKEVGEFHRAQACGYDQDDQLFFNLAMAYAELNRMEQSISAFEHAITLAPKNPENYFGLGLTAFSRGRMDLARKALSKAVELDPRHWDARIELARLDLDQGRLEAARIQLEAVQGGDPDNEELSTLWRIYHDRKMTAFDPLIK